MHNPVAMRLFILSLAVFAGACSTTREQTPPRFTLNVPLAFATSVTQQSHPAGKNISLDPAPYAREVPTYPFTSYHGWFGSRDVDQADLHGWEVRVFEHYDPKVTRAYARAKDGYDADLSTANEFFGDKDSLPRLFARFERKRFRWGNAITFLRQETDDINVYVPHNGHLTYEIWGVPSDHRYTVVASIGISHPKLADWGPDAFPPVRVVPTMEALRQDPAYKLVEICSPEEFVPSLTAFDRLVDSIRLE